MSGADDIPRHDSEFGLIGGGTTDPGLEAAIAARSSAPERGEVHSESGIIGRGMAFAAASFSTSVMLSLCSSIATSRIYGVKVIGEYALVCAPWIIVTQLSTINEQVELVRRISRLTPRHPGVTGLFTVVQGFSTSLTAVVSAVVMAITVAVFDGPVHRPDLVLPAGLLLAGYAVIDNSSWNLDMVFSAFRHGRELFIGRTTFLASFLALAVGLSAFTSSVWGLTLATIGAFATSLAVRIVLVRSVMALWPAEGEVRLALKSLPAIIRVGLRLLPAVIASGVSTQIGVWVLGSLAPVAEVGAFSRASGLSSKLSEAAFRVSEILFPTLVGYRDRGQTEKFAETVERTVRLTAVPVFLAASCAGGVARPVLQVFGPGFDRATTALTILFLAYGVAVASGLIGQALLAAERPGTITLTTLSGAFANLAVVYPFARLWAGSGVAAALALGFGVESAVRVFVTKRAVHGAGRRLRFGWTAMKLALAWGAGVAVGRAVTDSLHGFGWGIVGGIGSAAAYLAIVALVGLVTPAERSVATRRLPLRRNKDADGSLDSSTRG